VTARSSAGAGSRASPLGPVRLGYWAVPTGTENNGIIHTLDSVIIPAELGQNLTDVVGRQARAGARYPVKSIELAPFYLAELNFAQWTLT
jgi:hypothetical protein